MRRAFAVAQLKTIGYALVVISQIALFIYLYRDGWETEAGSERRVSPEKAVTQQKQPREEPPSLFRQSLTGKCVKRGDIDFVVTYTLWGNVMMSVFTISCSIPKLPGQTHVLIPGNFFRKHSEEKPIVRFASARAESKYTVLLLRVKKDAGRLNPDEKKNSIRWLVINVDGEQLVEGHYKWEENDHGLEMIEYRAPELSPGTVYLYILYKQDDDVDLTTVNLQSPVDQLETLIRSNQLNQVAAATFTTGERTEDSAVRDG